jgi:YbbR domain-containing protein
MRSSRPIINYLGSLLLSLVLAVFIWLSATQAQDPIGGQFLQVNVEFVGQPQGSILIQPQRQSVQIRVEGPESELRKISPADFEAFVDLSQVPYGETAPVPIRISSSAPNVDYTLAIPEQIDVLLEKQISREIPLDLDLRGGVARGHTQGDPLIEPAAIIVSGPESSVEAIDFALATIFLNSARETVIGTHRPVFYDAQGRVASTVGMELSTEQVQVTIPIEQSAGFAEKLITVKWDGEPASGYRLLNVNVEPPSVLVEGQPEAVNALTRLQTEPIDITGLTESFVQQVSLNLPAGITLDQDQEIFVSIGIEPILSTDTRKREVAVLGLDPELEAILSPDQVRVVLFGPLPALDALAPDDVRVTVDLIGLEPGEYSIEPQVDLPERGIELRSVQPSAVTIQITNTVTTTNEISGTIPITETSQVTFTQFALAGSESGWNSESQRPLLQRMLASALTWLRS